MIGLEQIYALAGLLFAGVALAVGFDPKEPNRIRAAGFYALLALSFLAGGALGDLANGGLALALATLAASGALERFAGPRPPRTQQTAPGWRLAAPALVLPAIALGGAFALPPLTLWGQPLLAPGSRTLPTLAALALGSVTALILAMGLLRARPSEPVQAARGLLQTVGWAALLPQMLAALGVVFTLSGVGTAVGRLAEHVIAVDNRLAATLAYCVGMAGLTIAMGNAFAAFPVMTAGIGLPLIVGRFHGDPAAMGAIGMLSGFCGTLVTPMAANFNLVPAALLQLRNRYGVIAVQAPTAALLLAGNAALMYFLAFPRG